MKATNPHEWQIDNLPNRLTMFRVLLIPVIIGSMFANTLVWDWVTPWHKTLGYVAAIILVAASITDFFDGYIARKRNIVTVFGSFLDPIADKFLVISSLIMLQELGRVPGLLVVVLVLRELYITSLRLLATERGLSVPVGSAGKWKTATQMVGIPFLMAFDRPFGIPMPELGFGLIAIASLLSVFSALEYSLGLLRKMKAKRKMAHAKNFQQP
ncbi:MAG: CDP-diacylglycerol--glycerol-3-phosphate 3-phosphatidyltransferase [Halobacteriovorax sp.]|nr:CDP-diacylglycerol--glycerol-3-phosphate 3-phosphatidyltransferase [Halobacteriovorax sp.]